MYGVRDTNKTGHLSENAIKNLLRRGALLTHTFCLAFANCFSDVAHRKRLYGVDEKIAKLNDRLQKTFDALGRARHRLAAKQESNWQSPWLLDAAWLAQLAPFLESCNRAEQAHIKVVNEGQEFIRIHGEGSGRVKLKQLDTARR